ncbi:MULTISPECIES: acyl-CoA dehydrogenase family protein [Gordonia]|jgi:alkylation response protein AidB-like acyl-CoA dehydrogenase|uniref:Acyl-CoA dehydrogenase n=1 Tax=Gordonia alkanivorans CGMCC 6845 TaxID=1423140 RepID=W9D668_9ACTN|nr:MULTISPECIES: acyl-CoA dehydrogenase family protein [Gordonia]ETA04668.1 acyl-CoA dehydrogenase [Gordonia alkanivorans CGMCC 6845]MDH3008780.1 acyl-CoA dehydrogenase family protein [Gordonia alkanivorans]MDH3012605.1 acyl-CoA dehydrogenase family protein [Gordonia alkanivorans]MDH3017651.1 acyl-CoA dehydrogenase family protein [Gordonia alkanivorans]MDH3022001.1 acyl-CoA dehydrogenase family protein [Gordonia alkanivorans]
MDLDFSEEQEQFRAELRALLESRLPDDWVGIFHGPDEYLDLSFSITREMAERGWLTQTWPEEYGGRGASNWRQVVLQEETWAYFEPRGGQYMGVNWIGPAIIRFGTDEQKMRFLPRIAAGDVQWAQLFSEPGAGSDLAALRTKATPTGDAFIVNGEKIWTSYGDYAEYGVLLARCEAGSERHAGLVVLLIDMSTPGIEVKPIATPLGKHKLNSVVFTDAVIPADAVLGAPGDGWRVAMASLAFERVGVARYARSTRILGELERLPEADRPEIQRDIATALAGARVAELMSYLVVDMKERGEVPTWQGSAARVHNVTLEQRVSAIADRVLGPMAIVDSHDTAAVEGGEIEDFTRLAPTGTVTAGAYEIQMGIIAQRGLGLERIR